MNLKGIKLLREKKIHKGELWLYSADFNTKDRVKEEVEDIKYISRNGGIVVILAHQGRYKDGSAESLRWSASELTKLLGRHVHFFEDNIGKSVSRRIEKLGDGEIAVLENLRFWMEKENDPTFARQLANFADIYVNEAFSASHRKHTSIVGVPKLIPSFAGFRFLEEYQNLSESFDPEHPFLVILGGAKFETKLPLVEKFLNIADHIFIGGAMAPYATSLAAENPKIILPEGDLNALDANPETLEVLKEKIVDARFILWNGPLGNYEKGFIAGTTALARVLSESKAKVIVGGGDTLATVNRDVKNEIITHGFISTAGGAMLDFLANGTLPGIEALKISN